MRRHAYALLVSFVAAVLGARAHAAPIVYSFAIAPESTLAISSPWMPGSTPLTLQGVVTGSVEVLGGTPLTVTSSVLAIGDFVVPYTEDLEHGVISFHVSEVTGHLSGGPTPVVQPPLPLVWDVAGFVLSIDAATVLTDDTGYTFSLPAPLEFVLSPGLLSADPNSSEPIALPVSASATLFGYPLEVNGTLLLQAIPEPGTLALVAAALGALAAARRTRAR